MSAAEVYTEVMADAPNLVFVRDVVEAYMKDRRNPFAERPCKGWRSLEFHFVEALKIWGDMPVVAFKERSKARVKAQVEEWRRSGLSAGTCRKRVSQLKTAFKFCVDEELLPTELMPVIKLPPQGAPRERFLDPVKELPALLRAADMPDTPAHIKLCLHLSLRTGQRQSAIRDLKWSNVDFENRVIRYRDTEAPDERSKKRRTDMPMCDDLYAMLIEAKENSESEYVLEWRSKKVASTYSGMISLYERAGITGLSRHDLRRTAATLAFRASGMKGAANFIGDTEEMAAKHYAQVSHEDRMAPVVAISDVLAQARAKRA